MSYFITKHNSKIFYRRSGTPGAQALLFIHGFSCDSSHWDNQIAFFEGSDQDYDIVALDLGGHGHSESALEHCTMVQYGDDVAALAQELNLKAPFLIGHSMGCRVAICAAAQNEDAFSGLALLDAGAPVAADELETKLKMVDGMIQQVGFPAVMQHMFEAMFFENADPVLKEKIMAQALAFDETLGVQLGVDLMTWEAQEQNAVLEKLTLPICGIVSNQFLPDFTRAPVKEGEYEGWAKVMLEKIPQIEITNLPDTGHFLMQERPKRVNKILQDFFVKNA